MTNNSKNWLHLDVEAETEKITTRLRQILSKSLKRRGLVVAVSGGIDSRCRAQGGRRREV